MASYIDPRLSRENDPTSNAPNRQTIRTSETLTCPLQRLVAKEFSDTRSAEKKAALDLPLNMFQMIQARYG